MSNFVGKPPFSNPLWVAIETMHIHIAHTKNILRTSFRILGVPMNNLAPMKIVLGGCKVPKLDAGVKYMYNIINQKIISILLPPGKYPPFFVLC